MAGLSKKKLLGLRLTIGRRVKAGDNPSAISKELGKKYGVPASQVASMVESVKANKKTAGSAKGKKRGRPARAAKATKVAKATAKKRGRGPGRPPGSKNKAQRPRGRKPGRPATIAAVSSPIILDAKTAEVVIDIGKKRLSIARVVYQDEKALARSIRKALSGLS